MCVIIDANVFNLLTGANLTEKDDFAPIVEWIVKGKGKLVIGGSKYKTELKKHHAMLRFVANLDRRNKVVNLPLTEVDKTEKAVKRRITAPTCNDHHLIAMVVVSRCRILCTHDKGAMTYITDSKSYDRPVIPPKIYQYKAHKRHLTDSNIAEVSKPCQQLNKVARQEATSALTDPPSKGTARRGVRRRHHKGHGSRRR